MAGLRDRAAAILTDLQLEGTGTLMGDLRAAAASIGVEPAETVIDTLARLEAALTGTGAAPAAPEAPDAMDAEPAAKTAQKTAAKSSKPSPKATKKPAATPKKRAAASKTPPKPRTKKGQAKPPVKKKPAPAAKPKKKTKPKAAAAPKAAPVNRSHLKAVKAPPRSGQTHTSQYVGVIKLPDKMPKTPWRAQMWNGTVEMLGDFATEMEAVRAYDARARELGKPMNFPDEVPAEASVETDASDDASQAGSEASTRSQYVGVYVNSCPKGSISSVNPWRACNSDGNIGCFPTEEEAARAYDGRARLLGKPVNFPKKGEEQAVKIMRAPRQPKQKRPRAAPAAPAGAAPARGSASSGPASAAAPAPLAVLDRVVAPFGGRGHHGGVVVAADGARVAVHFDDGDFEAGIDARRAGPGPRRRRLRRGARRRGAAGRAARPPRLRA